MLIIISNLFSSILILLSIIGYGNIFYNQRKDNDLFFIIIAGYFILGFIILLLHFFLSINNVVSLTIISIGIISLFITKFNILDKKFLYSVICLILANIILLGYSSHPIDANMYHHPYVSYLNSEKIIYSIANIEFRFGHISLLQYVQSTFVNNFLNPLSISSINIIFYTFFLIYCFDLIFKKNQNSFIFLLTILISAFLLIKIGRYREFGNDLIPFLAGSYFLINIVKEKLFIEKKFTNSIFLYMPIYSSFMLSHKVTYIFSTLIFFLIINKTKLIMLFKNKYVVLTFLTFTFLWVLKNYIETSCLVYPIVQTCIKNSGWYLTGMADPQSAMWLSEVWAKGFIDNPNWENLDLNNYIKNFNWFSTWLNNHFIKILEKVAPLVLIMIIISAYLLFFRKKNKQKIKETYLSLKDLLVLLFIISIGLFIWLFNSPLFRYGTFYIVSFIIIIFFIINFKLIKNTDIYRIEKLKIFFLISLMFFVTKNINRQIYSDKPYIPLTKPSSNNYKILYDNPKIISPSKQIGVCHLADYICSHEAPAGFQVLKKNNYFLIK